MVAGYILSTGANPATNTSTITLVYLARMMDSFTAKWASTERSREMTELTNFRKLALIDDALSRMESHTPDYELKELAGMVRTINLIVMELVSDD